MKHTAYNPMKLNPNDLITRLKTCSMVVLGERPSNKRLLQALVLHLTGGKEPSSLEMVALARALFGDGTNGLELAHEQ